MAKSSNQKLKIMYLAKILLEKTDEEHGLTMTELLEELARYGVKAERKSIYDDLEALELLGMDVVKDVRGKSTVYYLGSRDFELVDLKLMVDAVQTSQFLTKERSRELIQKIERLASVHQAKLLRGQVHMTRRNKTVNKGAYYTIFHLHMAIAAEKQVSFQYFKWNAQGQKQLQHGGKVYKVSPWALILDDEKYYLVAYDSEAGISKHYRVDKMLNLEILDAPREGETLFQDFDMGDYAKKTFGMFGGQDERVTLRCSNEMADIVIDRFGQDVIFCPVVEEGTGNDEAADAGASKSSVPAWFDVSVTVAVSPVFLTWVMNFGGKIRIMGPEHVIRQQVELAKKTISLYE